MTILEKELGAPTEAAINDLFWEFGERLAKEAVPYLHKKGEELKFGKTVNSLVREYEDKVYQILMNRIKDLS